MVDFRSGSVVLRPRLEAARGDDSLVPGEHKRGLRVYLRSRAPAYAAHLPGYVLGGARVNSKARPSSVAPAHGDRICLVHHEPLVSQSMAAVGVSNLLVDVERPREARGRRSDHRVSKYLRRKRCQPLRRYRGRSGGRFEGSGSRFHLAPSEAIHTAVESAVYLLLTGGCSHGAWPHATVAGGGGG